MPTVAISTDFFDAFARLPKIQQKKVREFTEKFRTNPTSASINYELVARSTDPRVRSVRIDVKYRAIVLHPDRGDVYLLVWVDNHDEAMQWAAKKRFEIHPYTGALQVFGVLDADDSIPPASVEKPSLLQHVSSEWMLKFGVPEHKVEDVRCAQDDAELSRIIGQLPQEAGEALTWLAYGDSPQTVWEAFATPQTKTDDVAIALQHPDSRRRFLVNPSDEELNAILNQPLEKWRAFLHPSQENLVRRDFNGPARVLGGAGTGKTVVAMHRARYLAKSLFPAATDRILFTTFSASLAQGIREIMETFCPDEMNRIDIVHLHAWAAKFLRSQGINLRIASEEDIGECWQEAIMQSDISDWSPEFLRREWDEVVQRAGITSCDDYIRAPRIGMGGRLLRGVRQRIWQVFEQYRKSLRYRGVVEWVDLVRETRQYLEQHGNIMPYRAVIVDEAQDFHDEEWRLLRSVLPESTNDLFIVGDAHQRIYGKPVVLSRCGINIRGRGCRLRLNYRTTREIRDWAVQLLRGTGVDDLDGGNDSLSGYVSVLSGQTPNVQLFDADVDEQRYVVNTIMGLLSTYSPSDICVVARTNDMVSRYADVLLSAGIDTVTVSREQTKEERGVRVATMHRVKGLEFPVMMLVSINRGTAPFLSGDHELDVSSDRERKELERRLLFVAATRARDLLFVTTTGALTSSGS